jgi:serine/threonine-protein kinase
VHDVERCDGEVLLVMEYVEGASLAELVEAGNAAGREIPYRVAVRVALDACAGLAAVHELTDDDGQPVGFLHRDVSPQNILVGVDGTSRITDFGLAKLISAERASGSLNGKLAYLAPEVIEDQAFSVQSDVFAMGVVLWETMANQRLFRGLSEADTVRRVGLVEAPPLSRVVAELGPCLDNTVGKASRSCPTGATRRCAVSRRAFEGIAGRWRSLVATSSEVSRYAQAIIGGDDRTPEDDPRVRRARAADLVPGDGLRLPGKAVPLLPTMLTTVSPRLTEGRPGDRPRELIRTTSSEGRRGRRGREHVDAPPSGTPCALEKPQPPSKERALEKEKSVSAEIPVTHTEPIEPSGGRRRPTAATDGDEGRDAPADASRREPREIGGAPPPRRESARRRGRRLRATDPQTGKPVPRFPILTARLVETHASGERERTTIPPASQRTAARSRWVRLSLMALVGVEIALVVAVALG